MIRINLTSKLASYTIFSKICPRAEIKYHHTNYLEAETPILWWSSKTR